MKTVIAALCITVSVNVFAATPRLIEHSDGIARSYIVQMAEKSSSEGDVTRVAQQFHAQVRQRFTHALQGFSANMSPADALAMSRDSRIKSVEQDRLMHTTAVQNVGTPTYHLDRIDQWCPATGYCNLYDYQYSYFRTGAGVRLYVVDSGINPTTEPMNIVNGYTAHYPNGVADYGDVLPHGTAVASLAGGATNGVAKGVTIVNVKVYDQFTSNTSMANVVGGLDWVAADHRAHPTVPAVANLSLAFYLANNLGGYGAGEVSSFEQAVINTIDAGVVVVCGAGNVTTESYAGTRAEPVDDACVRTPARLNGMLSIPGLSNPRNRTTITVGATGYNDQPVQNGFDGVSWSSATGPCVDLWAPGDQVGATGGPTAGSFSGTSASSPIVAGVVALYLEGRGANYDPNAVKAILMRNNSQSIRLVYSRVDLWQ